MLFCFYFLNFNNRDGKVAIVIMSGGQGTRLKLKGPKGVVDIGLPSHFSLFEYHIRNIMRVCNEAWRLDENFENSSDMKVTGDEENDENSNNKYVEVCLMTSIENDDEIKSYFSNHNFFNYPPEKSLKIYLYGERL